MLAALLALATLFVHDVHYLLSTSYWTDEAWVVVQTRFPLGDLHRLTSTTPIGWSFLIRLIPAGGPQRARLVPLAFCFLAVLVAYWFAQSLPWRARWQSTTAGVLGATAALLAPSMLVRDDLKQYTADALLALLVMVCTARLEQSWTRRRLATLAAVTVVGLLFSPAAGFVGSAALAVVVAMTIVRRDRARVIEAVVAGVGTAAGLIAVYWWAYARAVEPGLTAYWQAFYIAHNGRGARFVLRSVARTASNLGIGPGWLGLLLIGAGLVTVWRIGRPIVVLTMLAVFVEMVVLAAADRYPFLDPRTSTFFTVMVGVFAAIGIVGLCSLLAGRLDYLAVAICVIAAAGYVGAVHTSINSHHIQSDDVHAQVDYVAAHRQPADVVLVNLSSNWGFGYYWRVDSPGYGPSDAVLQDYVVTYPASDGIVIADNRTPPEVQKALAGAIALAELRHGRIWLIRTHLNPVESTAWTNALAADGQRPVLVGAADLTLLTP